MKRFAEFVKCNKKKMIAAVVIVVAVIVLCICLAFGTRKDSQDDTTRTVGITGQISEEATEETQKEISGQSGEQSDRTVKGEKTSENEQEKDDDQDTEKKAAENEKEKTDVIKNESSDQTKSDSTQDNSSVKTDVKKTTDKSSSGSDSAKSSGSSESSKNTASQSSKPSHQHSWKAHKVWVSKMVTVVDEPEHVVYGAQLYTEQSDGTWLGNGKTYWFENGFTIDDLKAIIMDKMKNEGYIGNYVNRQKTVPAVTHTEDHGSYQTDYYYCSCGAVKK